MSEAPHPVRRVHCFSDLEALSRAAARDLAAHIHRGLEDADIYTLALAGGSTPRRLYELLSEEHGESIPWERVHLFWGDERYVPHGHPDSNARLVQQRLVDRISVPESNVHPIPTDVERPEAGAQAYTETLQQFFPSRARTFDIVLLGLGADGHTASIFPETLDRSRRTDRWVRAVTAPARHEIRTRLTCTLPVLNGARRALFLVSGNRKREALSAVLDREDPSLPATHVRPRVECRWFVDAGARPEDEGSS